MKLKVDTMKLLGFNIDDNKYIWENWVNNGGEIINHVRKHRYFQILANNRYHEWFYIFG